MKPLAENSPILLVAKADPAKGRKSVRIIRYSRRQASEGDTDQAVPAARLVTPTAARLSNCRFNV